MNCAQTTRYESDSNARQRITGAGGNRPAVHGLAALVVIMTGLSRDAVTGMLSDVSIDGWLFKPFDQAELKTLLERAGPYGSAVDLTIDSSDVDEDCF